MTWRMFAPEPDVTDAALLIGLQVIAERLRNREAWLQADNMLLRAAITKHRDRVQGTDTFIADSADRALWNLIDRPDDV